ncbi:MAG: PQQ-like beta-propeller repeat protein [Bacteroidetes bacterium]|nr:PQQ-like beta-propeller repeat protein [Bacteroidota bacterium]
MKASIISFIIMLFLLIPVISLSQQESQFQGPAHDGIYQETGLMKSWPDNGPELLWRVNGLGNGYSSPAIASSNVFITGELDGTGFLFSFDRSGNLRWKKPYGDEWMVSYSGPRSTPVVSGDYVYTLSGMGKITCFHTDTGIIIWSLDMLADLHGNQVFYGFSESLLIDGDTLYCLPGGADTNIVALHRITGEIIWVSKGIGETAGYVSPVIASQSGRDMLICMSEYSIYSLDKSSGKLLWEHDVDTELDLACNYPIVEEGVVYYVTGPGNGAVKLELSNDGESVKQIWKNSELDSYFGGFIKAGDFLYGASSKQRNIVSVNHHSGETEQRLDFFKGAVVFADGMIYVYNQKGEMGLIAISNGTMKLISVFRPAYGSREPYAFPIIHNGILYIRHGETLMAYNIKEN